MGHRRHDDERATERKPALQGQSRPRDLATVGASTALQMGGPANGLSAVGLSGVSRMAADDVLSLQRTAGNAAVARMLKEPLTLQRWRIFADYRDVHAARKEAKSKSANQKATLAAMKKYDLIPKGASPQITPEAAEAADKVAAAGPVPWVVARPDKVKLPDAIKLAGLPDKGDPPKITADNKKAAAEVKKGGITAWILARPDVVTPEDACAVLKRVDARLKGPEGSEESAAWGATTEDAAKKGGLGDTATKGAGTAGAGGAITGGGEKAETATEGGGETDKPKYSEEQLAYWKRLYGGGAEAGMRRAALAKAIRDSGQKRFTTYEEQMKMRGSRRPGAGRSGVVIGGHRRPPGGAGRRPHSPEEINYWKEKYSPSEWGGIEPGSDVELSKQGERIMKRGEAGEALSVSQRYPINPKTGKVVKPRVGPRPHPQIPPPPFRVHHQEPSLTGPTPPKTEAEKKIWNARLALSKARIEAHREEWEQRVGKQTQK